MPQLTSNRDTEVTISEKGKLKSANALHEISGIGYSTQNLTVPNGKKWIIKAMATNSTGGTYTIDKVNFKIIVDSIDVKIYSNTSSASSSDFLLPNDVTLEPGQAVQFQFSCSAHSSNGNQSCDILYQEIDV